MADKSGTDGGVRELALFAGAGGGILAGHLLGWRTVCAVERNSFAASILISRQNEGILPSFPIWDDVHTFNGAEWKGIVDVVSGGFPCQAFSTAAAGRNVAADLWPEMRRIVEEVKPRYVFAENVSIKAINTAADDLETMGYETCAISLGARDLGGDHVRLRHWLLAYSDDKSKLLSAVDAKMAVGSGFCHSVWSAFPEQPRMVNGMAGRMDRFTAIGNGQIPIVAISALRLMCAS